jgi:hypothetical protein
MINTIILGKRTPLPGWQIAQWQGRRRAEASRRGVVVRYRDTGLGSGAYVCLFVG